MTRLEITAGALVAQTAGRTVVIQRVTDTDRFLALIGQGVSTGRAAAVASGLAVLKGMK